MIPQNSIAQNTFAHTADVQNMTHDELLAHYIDGTLSDAARRELEQRVVTSPELAQELQELQAIENLLNHQPSADDAIALPFLQKVENDIAAIMLGAGAAAGVGAAVAIATKPAGFMSWLSSLVASWSSWVGITVGASIVAGGAAATYYVAQERAQTEQASRQAVQHQAIQKPETASSAASAQGTATPEATSNDVPPNDSQTSNTQAHSSNETKKEQSQNDGASNDAAKELTTPTAKRTPKEYSGRIDGSNAKATQYAVLMKEYTQQLQAKEAQGDKIGAALFAKKLGVLERSSGNFAQSERYLEHALADVRALGLKEVEGETLGELGLLAAARGNTAQAVKLIQESVAILSAIKSTDATRWESELQRIRSTSGKK